MNYPTIDDLQAEITGLKAQLDQEKEQSKYLASLLDPDLVAGMSEMEKTRDRLAMAKVALSEFADSQKYDWDFYGLRFVLGDTYDENYVKPWDYAALILTKLEEKQ